MLLGHSPLRISAQVTKNFYMFFITWLRHFIQLEQIAYLHLYAPRICFCLAFHLNSQKCYLSTQRTPDLWLIPLCLDISYLDIFRFLNHSGTLLLSQSPYYLLISVELLVSFKYADEVVRVAFVHCWNSSVLLVVPVVLRTVWENHFFWNGETKSIEGQ